MYMEQKEEKRIITFSQREENSKQNDNKTKPCVASQFIAVWHFFFPLRECVYFHIVSLSFFNISFSFFLMYNISNTTEKYRTILQIQAQFHNTMYIICIAYTWAQRSVCVIHLHAYIYKSANADKQTHTCTRMCLRLCMCVFDTNEWNVLDWWAM